MLYSFMWVKHKLLVDKNNIEEKLGKFTTKSTSAFSAHIMEPIIIYEKENTRRIFIADINDAKLLAHETLSGTIVHQRKKSNDEWEDIDSINLATLKGGEGVKLSFKSGPLRKFFEGLLQLYKLSEGGVKFGEHEYVVGYANQLIKVPKDRKVFIQQLIDKNYGEEIWNEIIENSPDLATRLSMARLQTERQKALDEFKLSLNDPEKDENYWQEYFQSNQWIFGYGLRYYFLTHLSDQPIYGGASFKGKGNQKGDFLLHTNAEVKFTVLVEIKKPTTNLLAHKSKGECIQYRNGAWLVSQNLSGGVSQIQTNCKTWLRKSFESENLDLLNPQNIFTVNPKGILLIGNTSELDERSKIETFELYRRHISNPEIITFDELFERAKFIVTKEQEFINQSKEDAFDIL